MFFFLSKTWNEDVGQGWRSDLDVQGSEFDSLPPQKQTKKPVKMFSLILVYRLLVCHT